MSAALDIILALVSNFALMITPHAKCEPIISKDGKIDFQQSHMWCCRFRPFYSLVLDCSIYGNLL